MDIKKNIIELIGSTPMMELNKLEKENNIKAHIIAKLESFNPMGSTKDRVAYQMLKDAIKKGILKENSTIIEPTSGNTGIGLAGLASYLGYKIILTMPDTMSTERRQLLAAYGAQIVLTPGKEGMKGAIKKASELKEEIKDSFIPSQFENPSNPRAHFNTTAVEIWEQTEGKIDIFISGVGTGGTISGVGEYLKSKNPGVKIIALEPESSPVLSRKLSGAHKIQGIGAGFVPKTLNTEIYDEIITVKDEEAFEGCKLSAKTEGLLIGISSGAALAAAIKYAKKEENEGKNIVVLFPDGGEKYLSTPAFQ